MEEDGIGKEEDDEIGEDEAEEEEEVTIKYEVKNRSSTEGKLLFIYQSPSMKRLYQRYGSNIVFLDATYRTTKYALPLYFMVVKTNVNYQVTTTLYLCKNIWFSIKM